ncbi:MAG TPA: type II toxin-antitoxin system death-on-curing family toxin [bacterium]|nr:type II toxin-antitoxin system death-on-curing family toxin [bacterium]HQQ00493.1 type II toxin-antitoxin system death-on-curing family toxin [bacterium]
MGIAWIDQDVFRDLLIAKHGFILRNEGLLHSALDRPRNCWVYSNPSPTLFDLAAAYAFGITQNHPFVDGNKRASFLATSLFLEGNGWTIKADDDTKIRVFLAIARKEISENEFADWIKRNSKAI